MNVPLCLSFGAALTVAGVLLSHREAPMPDTAEAGVVFVYFPSLCATPLDASDCRELPRQTRPAFDSMAACFAYADVELARVRDPRVLASCLRQKEA
jgi:hypothetical protein